MPTENPRITITVTPELQAQLDDYKYKYRMKNQTQTIVSLIEKGIGLLESNSPSTSLDTLSPDEADLIAQYRTLDTPGRTLVDFVVSHEAARASDSASLEVLIDSRSGALPSAQQKKRHG